MRVALRQLSSDELQELVKLIKGCTCSTENGVGSENLIEAESDDYNDIILKNMDTSVEYVEKLNKTIEDDYADSLRDLSEQLAESKATEKIKQEDESKRTIGLLKDVNEALKKYVENVKSGGGTGPGQVEVPGAGASSPAPSAPKPAPAAQGKAIPATKVAGAIAVVGSTAFIGDKAYAVTSERGMRRGRMHQGMDIALPKNTPLAAHEEGEVVFAGKQTGYGTRVEVKTKDGRILAYSHLNEINVKPGQKVAAGDIIGLSGNTGTVRSSTGGDGSHLHMEVKDKEGNFLNPRTYLSSFVKPQDGMEQASASPATVKNVMDMQYQAESGGGKKLRAKGYENAESIGGAYHMSNASREQTFNDMTPEERAEFTAKTGFKQPPTLNQLVNKEGTAFTSNKAELADRMLYKKLTETTISKLTKKLGKEPTMRDVRGAHWLGDAGYEAYLEEVAKNPNTTFKEFYAKHPKFGKTGIEQFPNTLGEFQNVLYKQTKGFEDRPATLASGKKQNSTVIQPIIVNNGNPQPRMASTTVPPLMNQAGQKPKGKPGTTQGPGFPAYYS